MEGGLAPGVVNSGSSPSQSLDGASSVTGQQNLKTEPSLFSSSFSFSATPGLNSNEESGNTSAPTTPLPASPNIYSPFNPSTGGNTGSGGAGSGGSSGGSGSSGSVIVATPSVASPNIYSSQHPNTEKSPPPTTPPPSGGGSSSSGSTVHTKIMRWTHPSPEKLLMFIIYSGNQKKARSR